MLKTDTSLPAKSPGDRSFGFTVGGILAALGGVRFGASVLGETSPPVDLLTLGLWSVGGVLIALALVRPTWLALPNRLWHRFGLLIARVVNPVILFLLYAICIVPIGVVMRMFGHDPLRLRIDRAVDSYWMPHEPSPLEKPMQHPF